MRKINLFLVVISITIVVAGCTKPIEQNAVQEENLTSTATKPTPVKAHREFKSLEISETQTPSGSTPTSNLAEVSTSSTGLEGLIVTYDPTNESVTTYGEYISSLVIRPFKADKFYESPIKGKKVLVAVESSIVDYIYQSIDQYAKDLENNGYSVVIYSVSGGKPEDLRELLQTEYKNGLVGAILIGKLPIAWFEIYKQPKGFPYYEEFPCDLYFMDLDGAWIDSDGNGVFDIHRGDTKPEIWIGRLYASTLGDEAELLNHYFEKDHNYRTGCLKLRERSLVYVDDDWYGSADIIAKEVKLAYSSTILIKDKETTCRDDYRDFRLNQNYEWMHVMLHSSPHYHLFKVNDEWEWDGLDYAKVKSLDIKMRDPRALFYNLFACKACRYIERNYLGGWYIFADTYGLVAIGSTKTGAMYNFETFYRLLGEGESLGEAFKQWFIAQYPYNDIDRAWYYGLTLLGDPTLSIKVPALVLEISTDKANYYPGDTIHVYGALKRDCDPIENAKIKLNNPLSYLAIIDEVETDENGKFVYSIHVPEHCTPGTYTITASYDGIASSTSFRIESLPVPEIDVYKKDDKWFTSVTFYTTPCEELYYDGLDVSGNTFRIKYNCTHVTGYCTQMVEPYKKEITLGKLSSGFYKIVVEVNGVETAEQKFEIPPYFEIQSNTNTTSVGLV